jgi:hypothetical protein
MTNEFDTPYVNVAVRILVLLVRPDDTCPTPSSLSEPSADSVRHHATRVAKDICATAERS